MVVGIFQRNHAIMSWLKKVKSGAVDPKEWIAVTVAEASSPIVYLPIPKAANTSIRTALLSTITGEFDADARVHKDPRLPKLLQANALTACREDAFVFTVVRHPAQRVRSAYKNKIGKGKKVFGPARRVGIYRSDDFTTFLTKLASVPSMSLDSHFRPQTELLQIAMQDSRLQVYKMEDLGDCWQEIAANIETATGATLPAELTKLNASGTKPQEPFTDEQINLINLLYGKDFETFGYEW